MHSGLEQIAEHQASGNGDPAALRAQAFLDGHLEGDGRFLNYRDYFPALDDHIYCAHHAIGRPSRTLAPAMAAHASCLAEHGMGVFEHGFGPISENFEDRVRWLLGQQSGGVFHVQNFSDGLSALLFAGLRGRLLCGQDHFTSGVYLHERYADTTELEGDRDGWVPTERYIDALTPDTTIVSLSSGHWRTGRVHDLGALTAAMKATCPDAVLLLDVYQTLGTAPTSADWPVHTALIGGGVKQLHAGFGSGFVWATDALLERLTPNRSGWFAHQDPMSFAPTFTPATGGARFQTGAPNLTAMAAFLNETDLLTCLGPDPFEAIHARIANTIQLGVQDARERGLEVVGEPRAAFLAIRTEDGQPILERCAAKGVYVDFRPDRPESKAGLLRLSTAASAFAYELRYAIAQL